MRELIKKITSAFLPRWVSGGFLILVAFAVLCGSLLAAWNLSSRELFLNAIIQSKSFIWIVLAWALVSAAFPQFGRVLLILAGAVYLTQREMWHSLFLPSAFLILALSGSVDAARLLRGRFQLSSSYHWLLTVCVLFIFLPCYPWILLCVNQLTPPALIAGAGIFALVLRYFAQRVEDVPIPAGSDGETNDKRAPAESLAGFMLTLIWGAVFASAFFYLFPDAINGDSDKAYAAYPKFYAITNSLVLTEPGWTGVDNVMALYHHTQEMFLAAGWALGENNGLKFFALAIVVAKLWALFCLGHAVFKLSRAQALAAVALYAWIPVTVEIHGIIRPENLLTLYTILIAIAFENLRSATDISRPLWASLALLLIALGISVKLTGIYMIFACGLFYFPECLQIFQLVWDTKARKIRNDKWVLSALLLSGVISAFWFVRNYIRWGLLLNMSPFGQYHLTIWHPPIRRPDEWWMMFTEALVKVSRFTEFSNFGYGIVGVLFFGTVFLSLSQAGITRRIAGQVLIYVFMLLISTRQIRYILPIVPFVSVLIIYWLGSLSRACCNRNSADCDDVSSCGRLAILLHLGAGLLVIQNSYLYEHLWRRFNSFALGSGVYQSSIVEINKKLNFSNHVLSPYLDFNYGLNARMFRGEPYNSLGKLIGAQREHHFDYWLLHWAEAQMSENTYFNDPVLIGQLAEQVVKAAPDYDPSQWIALYRPSLPLLEHLQSTVKEAGFDEQAAIVVSDNRWSEQELDLFHPQPIYMKELPAALHLLTARWDELAKRYISVTESAAKSEPEKIIAWNFSDLELDDNFDVKCRGSKSEYGAAECTINIPQAIAPGQRVPRGEDSGINNRQHFIQQLGPDRQLMLKIFVRGNLTKPTPSSFELRRGDERKPLVRTPQPNHWTEIAAERVQAGEALVLRSSASLLSGAPRFLLVSAAMTAEPPVKVPEDPFFKTTVSADGVQSVSGAPASAVPPPILRGLISGRLQPGTERFVPGRITLQPKLPESLTRDVAIEITAEQVELAAGDTITVIANSGNRDAEESQPIFTTAIKEAYSCASDCSLATFSLASIPDTGRETFRLSVVISNASGGKSSLSSITLRAQRRTVANTVANTGASKEFAELFALRNLPVRTRELALLDEFRGKDVLTPSLQRGDVSRELQNAQVKNVDQIGATVFPVQVGKPGFATYRLVIPESLRNRPLQVSLRALGRTYQEGDKVAFHIKRGKLLEAALATGNALSPAAGSIQPYYEFRTVLPANPVATTIDVDCILVSTDTPDRTLLRAVAILAGDASASTGNQALN